MHITRITLFANVGVAASLVFIPNFARSVGATPDQIGVIFAAHSFMALLSSFAFGRYADVRGRKRVLQHFTWDRIAEKTLKLYRSLT